MNVIAIINSSGETSRVSTSGIVLLLFSKAKSPLTKKREILKEYTESDMPDTMLKRVHMGMAM